MDLLVTALVSSAVAIIGAASGLVVSWLNGKKTRQEFDDLKKELDEAGVYYVRCPKCGTKIVLTGSNIKREEGAGNGNV